MGLSVRHLRKADLAAVAECERQVHREHGWSAERIEAEAGKADGRQLVVEDKEGVLGDLFFTLEDDGYAVRRLTAVDDDSLTALVDHILDRARGSGKRKRVTVTVPDGDWHTLAFLRAYCFPAPKLVPGGIGPDHWVCTRQLPKA